jgi:hypothetical protein
MVRGLPSNPIRRIFSWTKTWEGIEKGTSRKRRKTDESANKRSIPKFFKGSPPHG